VVKIQNVSKEQKSQYIKAEGVVNELNSREIISEFPFMTEKIYVKVGDKVSKEQKIIKLNKEYLKNKILLEGNIKGEALNSVIAGIDNHDGYLKSPIDGVITELNIKEGVALSTLTPAVSISDLENLIITSYVPESIINDIYIEQKVKISGKSFDGYIGGKVIRIHPTAEKNKDNSTQSFIRVDIYTDKSSLLKPGVNVFTEFEKKIKDNSLIIPFDSVMFDEDKPYVYINRMGYAVKRYVNLGEEFETDVEILEGINIDDKLILNPKVKNLKNGSKLSVINGE
jgi:multidrug efflux pump subunit AcrA (membrane-fusion protein)